MLVLDKEDEIKRKIKSSK